MELVASVSGLPHRVPPRRLNETVLGSRPTALRVDLEPGKPTDEFCGTASAPSRIPYTVGRMKTSLYVSFPGNAREALEFYHGVFGGELDIITYGEQIDRGAEFPFDPPRDAVAHGTLTGPFTFGGGDDLQNRDETLDRGDFGFTVEVGSVEEGERFVEKLTQGGGKVTMPFAQAPWGAHFGVVEDKFRLAWNITTGDGR